MAPSATLIPYMGILGILIIMRLGPAEATTGFDCNPDQTKKVAAISFDALSTDTQVLHRNKLFASQHPDDYAYILMGTPGYTSIIGEDNVYIVRCTPVTVQLQPQDKCYDRLPIVTGNKKMFMAPWTFIITNHADEIPCDAPILQDYQLQGILYKALPEPADNSMPEDQGIEKLKPNTQLAWEYKIPKNLATSGIYTSDEVNSAWELKYHPERFNPPLGEVATYPDANGNVPGAIYLNRGKPLWYKSWNTYSILVVVAIAFVIILLVACTIQMISDRVNHGSALHSIRNRRRTRQIDSYQADLTIRLNKTPDV